MTINAKVAADLTKATTPESGFAQLNYLLDKPQGSSQGFGFKDIGAKKGLTNETGLNQLGRPIRVQPVTIVEESIAKLPYLSDVLQTITNMCSAYYLQAFAYRTAGSITGVNVLQTLKSLNPAHLNKAEILDSTFTAAKNAGGQIFGGITQNLGNESFDYPVNGFQYKGDLALESNNPDQPKSETSASIKENRALHDAPNLAVGKILEVKVSKDGNTVELPVQIILNPYISSTSFITDWVGLAKYDESLYMRFIRMKTGELSFWKDLVFMQDIIDKRNRVMLKDKSGVVAETLKRRSYGLLGRMFAKKHVSAVPASNIMVVSHATVKELERTLGGELTNLQVINRIFNETALMMIIDIDDMYGTIRIFQRGEDRPIELTDRDMKSMSKSNNSEINTILTSLMAGKGLPF